MTENTEKFFLHNIKISLNRKPPRVHKAFGGLPPSKEQEEKTISSS